jgi:hypothetical protein
VIAKQAGNRAMTARALANTANVSRHNTSIYQPPRADWPRRHRCILSTRPAAATGASF